MHRAVYVSRFKRLIEWKGTVELQSDNRLVNIFLLEFNNEPILATAGPVDYFYIFLSAKIVARPHRANLLESRREAPRQLLRRERAMLQ